MVLRNLFLNLEKLGYIIKIILVYFIVCINFYIIPKIAIFYCVEQEIAFTGIFYVSVAFIVFSLISFMSDISKLATIIFIFISLLLQNFIFLAVVITVIIIFFYILNTIFYKKNCLYDRIITIQCIA